MDYDVMRDEVVPLLKEITDHLSEVMDSHKDWAQRHELLVTLKVNSEYMTKRLDEFAVNQSQITKDHELRLRDHERSIIKIMVIGGFIMFLANAAIHLVK